MSWKYNEPRRENYDTEEEYERALEAYENARDLYIDAYIDSRREE